MARSTRGVSGHTRVVTDYEKLMRLIAQQDRKTAKAMRNTIREAGEDTRRGAQRRFAPISQRSASGYRVVVRQRGVEVEQSLDRVTGNHPEWGALQMRTALLPALDAGGVRAHRKMNRALEQLAREFNSS